MMNTKAAFSMLLACGLSLTEAVSIYGYSQTGCDGGAYGGCENVGNNVCCTAIHGTQGAVTGAVYGLPSGATFYAYQEADYSLCGDLIETGAGPGNLCTSPISGGGQYSGFVWNYNSQKRSDDESTCDDAQEMNFIVFANGTRYKLDGMKQEGKVALWNLAISESSTGERNEASSRFKQIRGSGRVRH